LPCPAIETHIDAEESGNQFLRTSPELHMKRLMCEGFPMIFQIGACFRKGEQGHIHHPEYTMLEWYEAGGSAETVLANMVALVRRVCEDVWPNGEDPRGQLMPQAEWKRITVSEAFNLHAGWDPCETWDEDRFDLDLTEKVEAAFEKEVPTVLYDYPKEAAALARTHEVGGRMVSQRWELYWGGVELANAYTELTDAVEQRARFEQSNEKRQKMGKPAYPVDEEFLSALKEGMPDCGGVALGVDRLAMLLAGADSLDAVLAFR
jgi:lysyl-tRNA synthetase class 2